MDSVRQRRDWPLRMHLAAFGVVLLLPAILIAALAIARYWDYERERLETLALDLATGVSRDIDRGLENTITLLNTLASSPYLDEQAFRDFHSRARLALQGSGMEIILIDPSMRQLLNTSIDYGVPLPAAVDIDTVQNVLKSGRPQISNLFTHPRVEEPLFNVIVPVTRDGQVLYLLLGRQPTRMLLKYVQRPGIAPEWTIGITGRNDVILTRSRDSETLVGRSMSPDALEHSTGKAGVHRGTNLEGVAVLRAYARSDLSGWLVAAFVPVSVMEAPLQRSWALFALGVGGLLLLSMVLAALVAQVIARPIEAIRRNARAMGRGEIVAGCRSPVREANEVAQELADASVERQRREEKLRFLTTELSHRTKNLIAVILSIARQSRPRSGDWRAFEDRFSQRLIALGKSFDLLIRDDRGGAGLDELVRAHLASFAEPGGGRLEIEGPPVRLNAHGSQHIGIALHELATNASKYGALSVPTGKIRIAWHFPEPNGAGPDGTCLRLSWQESGGPPVAVPESRGFGSAVLETIVPNALQADMSISFARDGLFWQLDVPAPHLV